MHRVDLPGGGSVAVGLFQFPLQALWNTAPITSWKIVPGETGLITHLRLQVRDPDTRTEHVRRTMRLFAEKSCRCCGQKPQRWKRSERRAIGSSPRSRYNVIADGAATVSVATP